MFLLCPSPIVALDEPTCSPSAVAKTQKLRQGMLPLPRNVPHNRAHAQARPPQLVVALSKAKALPKRRRSFGESEGFKGQELKLELSLGAPAQRQSQWPKEDAAPKRRNSAPDNVLRKMALQKEVNKEWGA